MPDTFSPGNLLAGKPYRDALHELIAMVCVQYYYSRLVIGTKISRRGDIKQMA